MTVAQTEEERIRWAIYAAILAALKTGHPRRFEVARALDALVGQPGASATIPVAHSEPVR